MKVAPYTDEEFEVLRHVAVCSRCGKRNGGAWRWVDGRRIRTSRAHLTRDGIPCEGTFEPALLEARQPPLLQMSYTALSRTRG